MRAGSWGLQQPWAKIILWLDILLRVWSMPSSFQAMQKTTSSDSFLWGRSSICQDVSHASCRNHLTNLIKREFIGRIYGEAQKIEGKTGQAERMWIGTTLGKWASRTSDGSLLDPTMEMNRVQSFSVFYVITLLKIPERGQLTGPAWGLCLPYGQSRKWY